MTSKQANTLLDDMIPQAHMRVLKGYKSEGQEFTQEKEYDFWNGVMASCAYFLRLMGFKLSNNAMYEFINTAIHRYKVRMN